MSFDHQIATASTRLQGALSLVTELSTISPSFTATTVGDFFAFLTIRFSNAYDPKYRQSVFRSQRMSDRGALVALVFLDANNNGVYDVGEVTVPSARVQAIQSNRGANTNEDGFAFIVGLPKNVLTDVIVVEGSLLDPFWLPSYEGRSIVPRAGSIHYLDFPIVETSEIEGKVLVLFPDTPGATPLPQITVQLVDALGETVDSKVSAFDGFFLFTKVLPGDYLVQADPDPSGAAGVARLPPLGVCRAVDPAPGRPGLRAPVGPGPDLQRRILRGIRRFGRAGGRLEAVEGHNFAEPAPGLDCLAGAVSNVGVGEGPGDQSIKSALAWNRGFGHPELHAR